MANLAMMVAGGVAVAVLLYGRVSASDGHRPARRITPVHPGDFLRHGDEVVQVVRVTIFRVLVRSHTNRRYTVSTWKLMFQNLEILIPF
jgi:hypothetical protein